MRNRDITSRGIGRDRDNVATNQEYELDYLSQELGVSKEKILQAIDAVGNNRQKVEEYLCNHLDSKGEP
jgi:hypothetical protein